MPASSDRNLLVALTALELACIDKEQLIIALQTLRSKTGTSLEDVLWELRYVDAVTMHKLKAFVDKYSDSRSADPGSDPHFRSKDTPGNDMPTTSLQANPPDNEAETSGPIEFEQPGANLENGAGFKSRQQTGSKRYVRLRPIAKGGQGEVSLAFDQEVHREVALKEIQAHLADQPDIRTRFVREAEITGGLEHPGVVPIYGLGVYPDGRPYYAMRFIQGISLRDSTQAFHAKEDSRAAIRGMEFRGLLGRFVDVCQTMHFAHSRAVLHRDLKPANIMLGDFGETLVVDWGLAKGMQDGDSTDDEEVRPVASNKDASITQPGNVLGTISYMSPEQASAGKITPASDIYSLGATLYYILTGCPPIQESDAWQGLLKAAAGDYPRPREVHPATPQALEAVCLKAMAFKPEDRYSSSRELADEIERYLGDEPVSAWKEPASVRAMRWIRHHGKLVSGTLAASLVAVITLGLASIWLNAARDRERLARENESIAKTSARKSEEQAIGHFQTARDAVDEMLTEVAQVHLRNIPGVSAVRERLLAKAAKFYDTFLDSEHTNRRMQFEAVRSWNRLAQIQEQLGNRKVVLETFRKGISLAEQLVADAPSDEMARLELAAMLQGTGWVNFQSGDPEQAAAYYQRTEELLKPAGTDNSSLSRPNQRALAKTLDSKGVLFANTGKAATAIEAYEQAAKIREGLLEQQPETDDDRIIALTELAATYNNLGNVLARTGDLTGSSTKFAKSIVFRQQAIAARPGDDELKAELALGIANQALLEKMRGEVKAAEELSTTAQQVYSEICGRHPERLDFRIAAARHQMNFALMLKEVQRQSESLPGFQVAAELLDQILKLDPAHAQARHYFVTTHFGWAESLAQTNRHDEAISHFDPAVENSTGELHDSIRALRAVSYIKIGRYQDATAEAAELSTRPHLEVDQYNFAAIYSQATTIAANDSELDETRRQELVREYEGQAMKFLTGLRESELFRQPETFDNVSNDPDLAALHDLPEFKELCEELGSRR